MTPADATIGDYDKVAFYVYFEDDPSIFHMRDLHYKIYSCENAILTPSFAVADTNFIGVVYSDDYVFSFTEWTYSITGITPNNPNIDCGLIEYSLLDEPAFIELDAITPR